MTKEARVFVGTMSSGEAEFDACCEAIASQTGVGVTHHVISGLRELEAHNGLWRAWAEVRLDHDIFVKVDADTILARSTALMEIAELFRDPDVTGAQILLHDFFTDGLIAGLNSFSPQVIFRNGTDRLYADRIDTGHKRVLKGEVVAHLAPIGWHCRQPHPRQAFHFGLHRALKRQDDVIARTAEVWLDRGDEGREWALAGAMTAGWRLRRSFDYNDDQFENRFIQLSEDPDRTDKVDHFARKVAKKGRKL